MVKIKRIEGSPYSRGVQLGEKIKDKIQHIPKTENMSNMKILGDKEEWVQENEKIVKRKSPEIIQEMRGLSHATKMEYNDILFSNLLTNICPSELLSSTPCSGFTVLGDKTRNGELILGRNLDWDHRLKNYVCYLNVDPTDRYSYFCSNFLNWVGCCDGVNEKGLAIAWAGVFLPRSELRPGLPMWMITKLVLENCSNVKEGLKLIRDLPLAQGANFLLIDSTGKGVAIEKTSKNINLRRGKEDFLIITNCFLSKKMKEYDLIYKKWPNFSSPRYAGYKKLIKGKRKIDTKFAKKMLSDKSSGIYGKNTLSSFICELKSNKIFYRHHGEKFSSFDISH